MARKRKKTYKNFFGKSPLEGMMPQIEFSHEIRQGIWVVLFILFGIISLLSLFGSAGLIGTYINQFFVALLGFGSWYSPAILIGIGYLLYAKEKRTVRGGIYLGLFMFVMSMQGLFHIFYDQTTWETIIEQGTGGGYIGYWVASLFVTLMGFWASLFLLIGVFLIATMFMFNKPLNELIGGDSFFGKLMSPFNWLLRKLFRRGEVNEDENEEEGEEEEAEEDEEIEEEGEEENEEEDGENEEDEDIEEEEKSFSKKLVPAFIEQVKAKKSTVTTTENIWTPTNVEIDFPMDFLSSKVGKSIAGDTKEAKERIRQTLENFGINVEMGDVEVGPTVTRYTLKPADGVKLSRITELSSNLAYDLAARSVRIEAPIPGKALVGIEVPNRTSAVVGLREVLENDEYQREIEEHRKKKKGNLLFALGKEVSGDVCFYDLADAPHLLVAGQTKSGKSVGINSIILSLLSQNSPDELRLIMVDPKRVELTIYNNLPHLLCPVITDVPKTVNVLKWCLTEMERRLDLMAEKHKVNIAEYNASSKQKLPYIVVIIDELADLMSSGSRKEVEGNLVRLLQMARAAGIHLVLATQRPSTDIILGTMKANLPARIAFAVMSGIDSRTILDSLGAEKLLGKGDMLFLSAEMPKPKRIQGAFVSSGEIKKIVDKLKEQGEPNYMEGITGKQKAGSGGSSGGYGGDDTGGDDDLYEEAKEIVINSSKASTSYLQRRLSIGYGRAAKLIDMLENAGIIGAPNGSKPREILLSKEQYEAMINQGVSSMPVHDRDSFEAPESFLDVDVEELAEEDEAEEFEEAEEEILEEMGEKVKSQKSKVKSREKENEENDEKDSEDEEKIEEDMEDKSEDEEEEEHENEDEEELDEGSNKEESTEESEDEEDDGEDENEEKEESAPVSSRTKRSADSGSGKKAIKKETLAKSLKTKEAESKKSKPALSEDDFDRLFSR